VGTVPWLAGNATLSKGFALHPFRSSVERFGEDFAVEAYLRDPYESIDVHREA
jgi:hypothetical protein